MAETLDRQLDHSTRAFLNHPANYRFEGNDFYVSKIFDWFREDFNNDILAFYLRYAEGGLKNRLEAGKTKIEVKYLDYDWGLNGE